MCTHVFQVVSLSTLHCQRDANVFELLLSGENTPAQFASAYFYINFFSEIVHRCLRVGDSCLVPAYHLKNTLDLKRAVTFMADCRRNPDSGREDKVPVKKGEILETR